MTAPGKTSSRGVEDEPPSHGNSGPGPDGASEIHPATREHQPDLGWITDPYDHHRKVGRPPGTAAPNYAWSLTAQVIAGFAPVAVSGSGRWPLDVAGAQRAADPDPETAVICLAASGGSPGPRLRLEGGIERGIADVVSKVGEGRAPDLGNDLEHRGTGVAGVHQCPGFGLADVAPACYQRTREAIQGPEPGVIRRVAGARCGDGAFVSVLHQSECGVGGHACCTPSVRV